MKRIIAFVFFIAAALASNGQCSTVSVQVSSSDTSFVQLYHAGFFNIPSGFANICVWEVTTFSGTIVYQDTTSGSSFEQGLVLFDHMVPITDSMKASIVITNNVEGIICTIHDTLYWKETEVIPGVFIGDWAVLSSNAGVEEEITFSKEVSAGHQQVKLIPSPVRDSFQIKGGQPVYTFDILDLNGQILKTFDAIQQLESVDVSNLPSGIYFVQFRGENSRKGGLRKLIKI